MTDPRTVETDVAKAIARLEARITALEEQLAGLSDVVTVEGLDVTITAPGRLSLEAREIDLAAELDVDITASMIDVNGNSVLTLTGSLIRLN